MLLCFKIIRWNASWIKVKIKKKHYLPTNPAPLFSSHRSEVFQHIVMQPQLAWFWILHFKFCYQVTKLKCRAISCIPCKLAAEDKLYANLSFFPRMSLVFFFHLSGFLAALRSNWKEYLINSNLNFFWVTNGKIYAISQLAWITPSITLSLVCLPTLFLCFPITVLWSLFKSLSPSLQYPGCIRRSRLQYPKHNCFRYTVWSLVKAVDPRSF